MADTENLIERWNKINDQQYTVQLALETLYRKEEEGRDNGQREKPSLEEAINRRALSDIKDSLYGEKEEIEKKLVAERMGALKDAYGLGDTSEGTS